MERTRNKPRAPHAERYAGKGDEPRHARVEREDNMAKFWLTPVRLQHSGGFNRNESGRDGRLTSLARSPARPRLRRRAPACSLPAPSGPSSLAPGLTGLPGGRGLHRPPEVARVE